jgi:hypothetical protein
MFEEGQVFIVTDLSSSNVSESPLYPAQLKLNETELLLNVASGEIQLLLADCVARDNNSRRTYRLAVVFLRTSVSEQDRIRGFANVEVDGRSLVCVEAFDRDGQHITAEIGVATNGRSFGGKTSPIHLLLEPGEYLAYCEGSIPVRVRFVVDENSQELVKVTLHRRD